MNKALLYFLKCVFGVAPRFIVRIVFRDIYRLHAFVQTSHNRIVIAILKQLSFAYWESFGSWVGINAIIDSPPTFPHGPVGFFVSNGAHIGRNCVIFQHVTIGSNTLKDSKSQGAPHLEDNVYIGCGAKIIGAVHVGNNARIGANCVVVKDVPDNSVTIIRGVESIVKEGTLDNEFVPGV